MERDSTDAELPQGRITSSSAQFTKHHFTFDRVFNVDSSQQEVYNFTVKPAISKVLEGYNSTILAYGQTGAGKTFTMEGKMPKLKNNVRRILLFIKKIYQLLY